MSEIRTWDKVPSIGLWCLAWKATGGRRVPALTSVMSYTRRGLVPLAEKELGAPWSRLRKMGAEAVPVIVTPRAAALTAGEIKPEGE